MKDARRSGWLGIALFAASIALILVVARHSPNAAVPAFGNYAKAELSPGITYLLTGLAALLGASSVACGLYAVRNGWRASAIIITVIGIIGAAALASSTPVGTADIGSYAAYGYQESVGIDSYSHAPNPDNCIKLNGLGVAKPNEFACSAEAPWTQTSNVYGPVATWLFKHSASGADSPQDAARTLQWESFIAFLLVGLMLLSIARTAEGKLRVALMWTANPLLQLHLVSGAHVDVFLAFLITLSVWLARFPLGRGAAAGLAVATKATAGWAALGLVLGKPRRGRFRRLIAAGAVVIVLYETASSHVFDQAHKASRYVSAGTPWRWVASILESFLPHGFARLLVVLAAIGVTIALSSAITVSFSHWPPKGTAERAARSALIPMLAWTLVAPYQLPWYDAVVWALLAASAAIGVDWIILLHTTVLTLAYLPGRVVPLGDVPHGVQVALRSGVAPVVTGFCAFVVLWALRRPASIRPSAAATDG